MNTTIDIICYKYKPLKNGECPLKVRVTKSRKRKYINLEVSVLPEDWDFMKNQPKATCPNRDYLEKLIATKICELKSKVVELKSEDKEFTSTTLVEKVINPNKPLTVKELFDRYVSTLEEDNRRGYALSVKQVYNSLIKFNKHLDIYCSEIDIAWLKRYEAWLRRNSIAENTIGIRFRTLRVIYNYGIEQGVVKAAYYPFRQYKVSKLHKETAKRAITKEDINKIIMVASLEREDYYSNLAIDIFAFSYYMGGINFKDIAYLTKDNLVDNRLIYTRKKTSKLINLPLHERAKAIIERYRSDSKCYLFPILSEFHHTEQQKANRIHKVITKVNKALKEIGEELQLPITLTTYVARHSYATVLKRAGVSTSIICESLGHSSEKVTQVYLDSFDNQQISDAMMNL